MECIVLLVAALLLRLPSQHHYRIGAAKDTIARSFVRLPRIIEMGKAVEEGVGVDDNRLRHGERRPSPQAEG